MDSATLLVTSCLISVAWDTTRKAAYRLCDQGKHQLRGSHCVSCLWRTGTYSRAAPCVTAAASGTGAVHR